MRGEVVPQVQTAAVAPAATRASGSVKADSDVELGARVEARKGDGWLVGGDGGRGMVGNGGNGDGGRRREVRSQLTPGSQQIVHFVAYSNVRI